MSWGLSFRFRHDAGGRDMAVHLSHDGLPARVSPPVRVAVTLLLNAPLLLAIGRGILSAVHLSGSAGGIDPLPIRIWAFAGPVVALALNLWWSGHARVDRDGNRAVSRELSFTLDPVSLALIVLAGFLVAAFYGHLLADAWACSNGVRSAC